MNESIMQLFIIIKYFIWSGTTGIALKTVSWHVHELTTYPLTQVHFHQHAHSVYIQFFR